MNQSIDLRSKLVDWFLYDNGLRHERVKQWTSNIQKQRTWKLITLFLNPVS